MRRVLALLVVVAVALAVPVLAAEKAAEKAAAKPMSHTASGTIEKWDDAAKTFTLKETKKEVSFVWNDKTKVEGAPKVGDHVTVPYMKEGDQHVAHTIAVHGPTKK